MNKRQKKKKEKLLSLCVGYGFTRDATYMEIRKIIRDSHECFIESCIHTASEPYDPELEAMGLQVPKWLRYDRYARFRWRQIDRIEEGKHGISTSEDKKSE